MWKSHLLLCSLQSWILLPVLCVSVGRSLLYKVLSVCVLQDRDWGGVDGWHEVGLVDATVNLSKDQVQRVSAKAA